MWKTDRKATFLDPADLLVNGKGFKYLPPTWLKRDPGRLAQQQSPRLAYPKSIIIHKTQRHGKDALLFIYI